MPSSRTLEHLAALYTADPDPWRHDSSAYERDKHHQTLAAIGPGPFKCAVEVGCGTGPLTQGLAPRCARLIAMDCIPAALAAARARLRDTEVTFVEAAAPGGLPEGRFDIVVLSEVLYFLEAQEVDAVAAWVERCATPGCRVVSVNWTGPTGHALTGRQAAGRLIAALPAWRVRRWQRPGYILDILGR